MNHKKLIGFLLLIALIIGGGMYYSSRSSTVPFQSVTLPAPDVLPTSIVELKNGDTYDLVASYVTKNIGGTKLRMLAYNNSVPGPTIRVHQGDEVTIRFKNNTDMPTLLHSHGVRMDSVFDGSQSVQKEMQPGETFAYVLKFPDSGVFWYHPHVREDEQQPMGLYGNFVVTPADLTEWNPVVAEHVLTLGDVLLEDGGFAPWSPKYITHALMGRFGNTLLVNGQTGIELAVETGEAYRFFLTNVATTRMMTFGIPGAKMKLVAADASRYENETMVDQVVLAPAERAIVEVMFPKAGAYTIEHRTPVKTYTLGHAIATDGIAPLVERTDEFSPLRTAPPALLAEFAAARAYVGALPEKRLHLTATVDMMKIMSLSGGMGDGHAHAMPGMDIAGMEPNVVPIEWEDDMGAMNLYSTSDTVKWVLRDEDTGKENMDIDWTFSRGRMVKIRIINDADSMHPMQHPFHMHGNRFLVLSVDGVSNNNLAWKDTVLIPGGSTVDILLDASNPGVWMAHCHIAEHLHSGMMLTYKVE
jgi:FtsP/CotA-like multicopper oxidase with cupredoxin domain